jgi:hypothetical protein
MPVLIRPASISQIVVFRGLSGDPVKKSETKPIARVSAFFGGDSPLVVGQYLILDLGVSH